MSTGAAYRRGLAPSITVRDVLRLPCAAGGEVVAGAAGLDRPVRWVHVSELLDIARLLTGGEFLLTTGMKLREARPDEHHAYVQSLAQVGVAALGLELVLWLQEPPEALISACDSEGLPLIVWRSEVRFRIIAEEVSRLLFERQRGHPGIDEANLAEELLSGSSMEPLLRERIEIANLALGKWLAVVVFEVVRPHGDEGPLDHTPLVTALRNSIPVARKGSEVSADVARLACSDRGRLLKLILTGPSAEALRTACDRLVPVVHQVAAKYGAGTRIRMGVGRPRDSLVELADALREAVVVIRFQESTKQERRIHFDEVRLGRFLLKASASALWQLVQNELGPLLMLPAPDRDELLRTLSALLEENFNVTAAAKRLHLRRQSLYWRMERLKALLGPDMDQCDRRAALLLALRARELLGSDALHYR